MFKKQSRYHYHMYDGEEYIGKFHMRELVDLGYNEREVRDCCNGKTKSHKKRIFKKELINKGE